MFSKVRPLLKNKAFRRNITTVVRSQDAALLQHKKTLSLSNKRDYAIVVRIKEFGAESIVEGTVQKWTKNVGTFFSLRSILFFLACAAIDLVYELQGKTFLSTSSVILHLLVLTYSSSSLLITVSMIIIQKIRMLLFHILTVLFNILSI